MPLHELTDVSLAYARIRVWRLADQMQRVAVEPQVEIETHPQWQGDCPDHLLELIAFVLHLPDDVVRQGVFGDATQRRVRKGCDFFQGIDESPEPPIELLG